MCNDVGTKFHKEKEAKESACSMKDKVKAIKLITIIVQHKIFL